MDEDDLDGLLSPRMLKQNKLPPISNNRAKNENSKMDDLDDLDDFLGNIGKNKPSY